VRGGTLYDFSVEVRGNCKRVSLGACAWKTGLWKDGKFLKTTFGTNVPVSDESWTAYRGSFTVPEGMTRASVYVQVWNQLPKDAPIRMAMMPMTTSISTRVNPARPVLRRYGEGVIAK